MSIKEKYHVTAIPTYLCKEWVLKKHYAKRLPPIEFAFGLYDKQNILEGIVTYGTPVSNSLRQLWHNKYKVFELNRLIINEGLEKNCLSFLISKSFNFLPKPSVLVSYADTAQNHHGYIYQATNWVYTGLSAVRRDYSIKGMEHLHSATIADISRGHTNRVEFLKNKFAEKFMIIDRARKHRYFYFIGSKNQKKDMLRMLPYKIEPYPKGDNIRYDASYVPTSQLRLF